MIYLQLSDITKSFNGNLLLQGVDLTIQANDRIGLVGPNGSGKTTFLKIAKGEILPDGGRVSAGKNIKIGYVSQEDEITSELTLFLAMIESYTELLEIKWEMNKLEPHLAAGDEENLTKYGELQQQWEHLGGYNYEADIKNALTGLGFSEADLYRPVKSFSGGERNRAALALALLHSPDLLLLDEPTNHLDIESTIWLEQYLVSFAGAVVVVSHDRIFLDHLVSEIIELEDGYLELYHGSFSSFWEERKERRRLKLKKYLEQKEEIERVEDFIRRNIAGQKTKQAQSRRLTLSKIERLQAPGHDVKRPTINLKLSRRSYFSILEVENLSFSYGDRYLLNNIAFKIERGEKVGLIGKNGSGKSTLVKLIVGELQANEGVVNIGHNVDVKYFDQELSGLLPEQTVLDTIWDIRPDLEAFGLRSYLARFLFFGEDVFKQVRMLSGGEKKKLALCRLLALPANFLILDEPTNHLDIGSLVVFQQALREYNGTLFFISHDRYFLDSVATRILAIENETIINSPGNYSDFVTRYTTREPEPPTLVKHAKRNSYRQEKKEKNVRSARLKRIKELELLIAEQEEEIESLQQQLLSQEFVADWEKLQRLQENINADEVRLDQLATEYYRLIEENETADN